jgi:DNA polymerase III sliding clamp (beta) subunit (PCNA family)
MATATADIATRNKILKAMKAVKPTQKGSTNYAEFHDTGIVFGEYSSIELLVQCSHGFGEQTVSKEQAVLMLNEADRVYMDPPRAPDGVKLSSNAVDTLNWVATAADEMSMRYTLAGILFEGSHVVATDGRRMHIAKLDINLNALIPLATWKAAIAVAKAFRDPSIYLFIGENGCIEISGAYGWTIRSSELEGRYPRWETVIPDFSKRDMPAYRTSLSPDVNLDCKHAIKKTRLRNAAAKAGLTKRELKDFNEADPAIEIPLNDGLQSTVCVNAEYLLDAMQAGPWLEVAYDGNRTSAITVQGDDGRMAVIMPMDRPRKAGAQ